MHLAIDAVGIKHSGGATVLQDFMKVCIEDLRLSQISIFLSPQNIRNFVLPKLDHIQEIEKHQEERSRIARYIWYARGIEKETYKLKPDKILCFANVGSNHKIPSAIFLQQALIVSPEITRNLSWKRRLEISVLRMLAAQSYKTAKHIFVQSRVMAERLHSMFNVPLDNISVHLPYLEALPQYVASSEKLRDMKNTDRNRCLLYVGSQSRYKNIEFLIQGFKQLRQEIPDVKLFLTLPHNHKYMQIEGVHCVGYLSKLELREAYELATVLVMPSLVETVGLPMLEAMTLDTPILAANLPYAHEMCEDAAVYFNPASVEIFVEKASALLVNPNLQKQCINAGTKLMKRRKELNSYQIMLDILLNL